MNNLTKLFDKNGNCPTIGDPYREATETTAALFNKNGYLHDDVKRFLEQLVRSKGIKPMCDAVILLVADNFARNTKGNYNTTYYWR